MMSEDNDNEELDAFQMITNLVPQIIWTNDRTGFADYFNKRWYDYTGLTYSQSAGPGWQAVAHQDDIAAMEAWRNAFVEKQFFESEARLKRRDGKYEWHLLQNMPFLDDNDSVESWFGSATNIQRLKDVNQAYHQSTRFIQAVLDSAKDFAIITLDQKGYIKAWSAGAEKLFGYSEEEALGKHTDIIFTEEDKLGNIPETELRISKESGRAIDERWHIRKNGMRFFMSGVMTPIKGDNGFVKITRDITDRKLAEEALLLAEHRNSVAMHSAKMGEWKWNMISNQLTLDEKSRQILSIVSDEDKLYAEEFWKLIHPEDVDRTKEEYRNTLSGLNIFQLEIRIALQEANEYKWINLYGRVISHENDIPKEMIGVIYDISERKFAEKQKDEFVSIASHELKTPVTSIKAYCELLDDIISRSDNDENTSLVRKLNIQVDRLIGLLNVLLDHTKVRQGRLAINPVLFDLNGLLREQIEQIQPLASRHSLLFNPASIAMVHADRDRIGEVVTNFLSNAVKYSPTGNEVIISSEDASDGVIVKIQDFGPGISREEQPHLFEEYYRGMSSTVRNQTGFGLGLYVSAGIIEQHHGLIGVESRLGEGATFYFKLFYT
ncbi:MAG TPA: PAS domain S-box protein [Flavitalea sp.]|nr:PAS domain S-box protein [Flavitalea sp.]